MASIDKIKNLISDGKTQQAVDMLQDLLKQKGGNDPELLNKTLLLEGQYKDLKTKALLAVEDVSADINRINFSLLTLCDQAEGVIAETEKTEEKTAETAADTEGSQKAIKNAAYLLGGAILIVILIFSAIFLVNKSDSKAAIGKSTEVAPLPVKPVLAMPKNWTTLTSILNVTDKYYGDYKVTISAIKSESFDAERDKLTLNLTLNCVKSYSGKCLGNYLKFRLTPTPNQELEPESDKALEIQSDKTSREETVSFIVPKSVEAGMLDIFYVDKPKSKATTKISSN